MSDFEITPEGLKVPKDPSAYCAALVKRLRDLHVFQTHGDDAECQPRRDTIYSLAADEIERLEKERDSLAAQVSALRKALDKACRCIEAAPVRRVRPEFGGIIPITRAVLSDTATVAREHDRQKRIEGAEEMALERDADSLSGAPRFRTPAEVVDAAFPPEGGAK